MSKITLFLLFGLIGSGALVVHQSVRLNTIISNSRHSSLMINWVGDSKGYGLNSPPIGSDGTVIGGVKTSAVGNGMMIEMVINKTVYVGVTRNGEVISTHALNPGDNVVVQFP